MFMDSSTTWWSYLKLEVHQQQPSTYFWVTMWTEATSALRLVKYLKKIIINNFVQMEEHLVKDKLSASERSERRV